MFQEKKHLVTVDLIFQVCVFKSHYLRVQQVLLVSDTNLSDFEP